MKSNIGSLYPKIYKGIIETDELARIEDIQFDEFYAHMDSALRNQFVQTADIAGIQANEKLYKIRANPSAEDIDFRRQRLLNRMKTLPPFTIRYLEQRLDEIIGKGAYTLHMDNNAYTLFVEAVTPSSAWYHEVSVFIGKIKPANIVYAFTPLLSTTLNISETISLSKAEWNYILNGNWRLGEKPFAYNSDTDVLAWYYHLSQWKLGENPFGLTINPEVIKMPSSSSLKAAFLAEHAELSAEMVACALLNDAYRITEFLQKDSVGQTSTIKYRVPEDIAEDITNIKLLDSNDEVLAESAVFVPIAEHLTIKHTFNHKEGV